ncbi:Flp family type IVb pilin [Trinickia violacea]|uniref:Flp family type IVb pilin n=1 Tax=Trinickia violacea TaxID=2571746 RepID=A0A4P8J226_9BURK|nr:Flp family type IVb pilin [Trinickia violacea]
MSFRYACVRRLLAGARDSRAIERTKAFLRDDEGATMVEYGLMVALIAIVCIGAVTTIGTNLNLVFSDIAAAI